MTSLYHAMSNIPMMTEEEQAEHERLLALEEQEAQEAEEAAFWEDAFCGYDCDGRPIGG